MGLSSITNPLQIQGLTIIDQNTSRFNEELSKLIEPANIAKASPLMPFAVLLSNDTGRYLYSITIIYTYSTMIAPAGTPWQYRVSRSAATPDNRLTMIAPGDRLLVAPVGNFFALAHAGGQRVVSPYFDEGLERLIKTFETEDSHEEINVAVDSVIFEDGTLVGPDTAKRMDKVNARIRAEKDIVAGTSGLHGEDLRQKLITYSDARTDDSSYSDCRTRTAQFLAQVLSSRGEPAVLVQIQNLSNVKWFNNSQGVRRNGQ